MMNSVRHGWKRSWALARSSINLSDGGFLADPEGLAGAVLNAQLKDLPGLAGLRFAALLGEAGIGKSSAVVDHAALSDAAVEAGGDQITVIDLSPVASLSDLESCILRDGRVEAWRDGAGGLLLYLDSLDECVARAPNVASYLPNVIGKLPLDRLRLRIVCRPTEWPVSLEQSFAGLFGSDETGRAEPRAFSMAPLRRVDVGLAASDRGIDAAAFLEAVESAGVTAFAVNPLTLDFLIRAFEKGGALPASRWEIFEDGCRGLCTELGPSRRVAAARTDRTPARLLAVAGRIAFVTRLTNRSGIRTERDPSPATGAEIDMDRLIGGVERADDGEFELGMSSVREAVDSSLFAWRRTGAVRWAHPAYEDFLAAWYIHRRQFKPTQVVSLLRDPGADRHRVAPQLSTTAAWIASRSDDLFAYLCLHDPETLLLGDVVALEPGKRHALIGRILAAVESGKWSLSELPGPWGCRSLDHADLSEQLAPYIRDPSRGPLARWFAISIAAGCRPHGIAERLTEIALDPSEQSELRTYAAGAVIEIGDAGQMARLRPLAEGTAGDDPNDELKGVGLRATWPGTMPAQELFRLLTWPKDSTWMGTYWSFLQRHIGDELDPGDVPIGLEWLSGRDPHRSVSDPFYAIRVSILRRALLHTGDPDVLVALTTLAVSRLESNAHPLGELIGGQNEVTVESLGLTEGARLRLVAGMVRRLDPGIVYRIVVLQPRLLDPTDADWLVRQIAVAEDDDVKDRFCQLAALACRWYRDVQLFDRVHEAAQEDATLARALDPVMRPIDLNAEEATNVRARDRSVIEADQQTRAEGDDEPLARRPELLKLLERVEGGDWRAWGLLPAALEGGGNRPPTLMTVHKFPGWIASETEVRDRILAAAERYVISYTPNEIGYTGGHMSVTYADIAGLQALYLLEAESPDRIHGLTAEQWSKWAEMIIDRAPCFPDEEALNAYPRLAALAYHSVPEAIRAVFMRGIRRNSANWLSQLPTAAWTACWDEPTARAFIKVARDTSLSDLAFGAILQAMLAEERPPEPGHVLKTGARRFVESFIRRATHAEGSSRAVTAVQALSRYDIAPSWPCIWNVCKRDVILGRSLIVTLSHGQMWFRPFIQRLSHRQLEQLAIWVHNQAGGASGERLESDEPPGSRDALIYLMSSIVQTLEESATESACLAIVRIGRHCPGADWIKAASRRARDKFRRNAWLPHDADTILDLAKSPQKRVVRCARDLMEILLESLDGLQQRLDRSMAQFLWDSVHGRMRPKDESAISDFLEDHIRRDLRESGIVSGREVQISRGGRGHPGRRTDLLVHAVPCPRPGQDAAGAVSVIIEVKGCWHADVERAMETQLRDRYLTRSGFSHGIYLVCWYPRFQWDAADTRRSSGTRRPLAEARGLYNEQAETLSTDGVALAAFVLDATMR